MKTIQMIILICSSLKMYGQNDLIKNGDFENCFQCDEKMNSYWWESNLLEWKNPAGLGFIMYINSTIKKAERDAIGFDIIEKQAYSGKGFIRLLFDNKLDSCLTNTYIYSRNADYFREKRYIQSKLKSKLIKNKLYCFSVYLRNLGNMSKIEEIGVALSNKEIGIEKRRYINYDCDIKIQNIENVGYRWQKFCSVYKAKGNEKYITLGQFLSNNKFKNLSKDDSSLDHEDNSIDIDDISIVELSDKKFCDCNSFIESKNNNDTISVTRLIQKYGIHGHHEEFSSDKNIDVIKIGCLFKKNEDFIFDSLPPNDFPLAYIDYFIKYMQTVNNFKLEIIASVSGTEGGSNLLELSKRRAKLIYDRFVSAGVDINRLSYSGVIDIDISEEIGGVIDCYGEIRLRLNIKK